MPGLYIHIPFCERKCIYCAFYSIETIEPKGRFLDTLLREIDMRADLLADDPDAPESYSTIFFGGGTPSLLSPDEIGAILGKLRERFVVGADAEITMECNPGALTASWLEGYRAHGVNRLSFGVQSFHDDELRFLSRIHTADQAKESIRLARTIFDNVSLDLIFALPDQTLDRWHANLEEGVRLGTTHFSAYSLIFEEGTRLNVMRLGGEVAPAEDSIEAEMYEHTVRMLSSHGFGQYEVSNYARPGRECRHNVGYWERQSYTSFGPSAHSFMRRRENDIRWANVSSLSSYLDSIESGALPVASRDVVSSEGALEEIVMLGLRSGGIVLNEFERVTGRRLQSLASSEIAMLVDNGYARIDEHRLSLTASGYLFADRFALRIIDAVERTLARRGRMGMQLPVV